MTSAGSLLSVVSIFTTRLLLGTCAGFFLLPVDTVWAADTPVSVFLTPVAGYQAYRTQVLDFDAENLAAGSINQQAPDKYQGPLSFEGKVSRLDYRWDYTKNSARPSGALAIVRNYAHAIEALGGRQLNRPKAAADAVGWHVFELVRPGVPTVHLLLNPVAADNYSIVLVESKPMEQTVKASDLASQIQAAGFATLYIQFETNKADLLADGHASVAAIATLLREDPSLRQSIEGHTDNVGQAGHNKTLSLARAAAVLKAVVAAGIDAKRLQARGQGQDVPIADNRTEAGRAKNRRVELVKLK
jgi:outer membrane protein OmpA-like peptidoglycan-associated protein